MYSRASITVPTRSDFKVKRTIDSANAQHKLVKLLDEFSNVEYSGNENVSQRTYLSFSVPKIDAKYSAIIHTNFLCKFRADCEFQWNFTVVD